MGNEKEITKKMMSSNQSLFYQSINSIYDFKLSDGINVKQWKDLYHKIGKIETVVQDVACFDNFELFFFFKYF